MHNLKIDKQEAHRPIIMHNDAPDNIEYRDIFPFRPTIVYFCQVTVQLIN